MNLGLRILLICLLLAGSSTLVVVAGVVWPKLEQYPRLDAQLAEAGQQQARLAALSVENELERAGAQLANLAQHEALAYRDHARAGALMAALAGQTGLNPRLVALDERLQAVAGNVSRRDFTALDPALVRRARQTSATAYSGALAWPDGGQPCVVAARRYRYYDRVGSGEHWGLVLEGLPLAALDQLVNQGSGRVSIYDTAGLPLVPAPAAVSGLAANQGEEVRAALAGRKGVVVRAEHSVQAYHPVRGVGWAVVAAAPTTQVLLPLERDIRQATLAGALAMGIGAVLAVLLSMFLVAPIRRLEARAAALARGEWDAAPAPETGPAKDELDRLAESFEVMAERLRGRFAAIEEQVAQRTADLEAAVEELKALDELKRAFLDAISHELRTPLNFIMGYGSTLADGLLGPLSPDQARAIEAILAGSDRLLGVINDLIEISRLEAGLIPLLPTSIDLVELAGLALEQLEPQSQERKLAVSLSAPHDLPPAHADPERVGQILRQLLTNAIKFTEPGGRVEVRVRHEGGHLVTEVHDTGVGIPAEALPYIWESFRQGDGSLTRRHGGTGVGLAIVKRLIEAMGEQVEVESTEGRGSCFRFTLPVAGEDGPTGVHERRVEASSRPAGPGPLPTY